MKTLIRNAMIVTMDEDDKVLNRGYLLVDGDTIQQVGEGEFQGELNGTTIIEGSGHCVMPGLVNGHTHAAMTLLRGYGEGYPLMRWLNEKIWPAEAKFTEKHIELGTKLAAIEMLRSGTTAFNDMYFHQEQVMNVAEQFNIRAVLGIPIIGDQWESQLKDAVKLSEGVRKGKSPLVKAFVAPHSPYTLSKDALRQVGVVARDMQDSIHIHIAETEDEVNIINERYGMTPCEFLEDCGIFKSRTVGAHCVHMTDGDIEIMKKCNVSAVYNPQSNMKLASGTARVVEMLERGVNVCFGTDGTSSNNNLNLFEEMETGAFLQKLHYKDATKLDASTALEMATANGAKALGFEKLGMLKAGFKADLVMLNINKPHMVPMHDIHSNIAFSANGSEVDHVMVNGKLVMNKGEFASIDEEKIMYECNKLCRETI